MKKIIIGIIIGLSVAIPATSLAGYYVSEKGEWSDWWNLGGLNDVKRIYDKENKLVCWVYSGMEKGGISCQPSLELDHPSTR